MAYSTSKVLLFALVIGLGISLVPDRTRIVRAPPTSYLSAGPNHPAAEHTVFLATNFSEENLIQFTANVAASNHPGLVLLDTPKSKQFLKSFLEDSGCRQLIPVGSFLESRAELEQRLNVTTAPIVPWNTDPPSVFWQNLFPKAEAIVVCPCKPRRLLLQGACLAGVLRVPLVVVRGDSNEADAIRQSAVRWHTKRVFALGESIRLCSALPGVKIVYLANEEAVAAACIGKLAEEGTIHNLVVANPEDSAEGIAGMSTLAPWIAVQRRAALLLTNAAGGNVSALVKAALKNPDVKTADTLILAADLKAIPMETRPNPIAGKDTEIEMEPLTPRGTEPFSFATGRLFHEDVGVVALMLARQRLWNLPKPTCQALVASNAGEGLPLLETFSQTTARELANRGFQTKTLFGNEVNKEDLRRLLPDADVFLWEGHHNTLINEYGFSKWEEPLRPSLVFLQSCLALTESKAGPLLERGAVAVVGSSTRIYSATGGAFSLAFFDGLLYDGQSLGGSLRQAKNFLLAYTLLKEKRLANGARMNGANLRSAWAFTLWGDPTLKLPIPKPPADALPAVRHRVQGNTIIVSLPEARYERTSTVKYYAQMLPNQRLAGLLGAGNEVIGKHLVPLVFVEVTLPRGPPGKVPQLTSRLPSSNYLFCWDPTRQSGYLLAAPRAKDRQELRFHVNWDDEEREAW
jgi:hypothetical protein